MKTRSAFLSLAVWIAAVPCQAITIAQWTFETSKPATAGPIAPEVGNGTGTAVGTATYSHPFGNGSVESWSAESWSVDDYWQFHLSTIGCNHIIVSYDQASSNTGPGKFKFGYGTDGVNFTFGSEYTVLANASPNPPWNSSTRSSLYAVSFDLSLFTSMDNAGDVYFRIVDTSSTSANGGTVASGGTGRIDNFTVSGTQIPESGASALLLAIGLLGTYRARRVKA